MYSSEEGLLVGVVFVDGGVGQRMEGGDAVAVADGSDFFFPTITSLSRPEPSGGGEGKVGRVGLVLVGTLTLDEGQVSASASQGSLV